MLYQHTMYPNETVYIAGPECFYTHGNEMLLAMRREAEAFGMRVSLPNDKPLNLSHANPNHNADEIFANCSKSMDASTAIIADLETFRGCEPDGGTLYEIGMAYALGIRRYAYTRDKRSMLHKYPGAVLDEEGLVRDREGRVLPYQDLPFSPCTVAACKIVEGNFSLCLQTMMQDMDEERKEKARRQSPATDLSAAITQKSDGRPLVYLASAQRYDPDAPEKMARMKALCESRGWQAVSPLDQAPGVAPVHSDDPYTKAHHQFDHWQQHVRNCDILLADLQDFHGLEPSSDVSFEAGMAWQLGKKCFGWLPSAATMRQRIPHYGEERGEKDIYGNDVENFDYPINLMFASSMPILSGDFEAVLGQIPPWLAQGCAKWRPAPLPE